MPFRKERGRHFRRRRKKAAGRPHPHETESEFRESAHEVKSESKAGPELEEHETESEFRESAHEVKSEPEAGPEPKEHGTESEFRESAHESKSELQADFVGKREPPDAEGLAWALLEGLRLAAGARWERAEMPNNRTVLLWRNNGEERIYFPVNPMEINISRPNQNRVLSLTMGGSVNA